MKQNQQSPKSNPGQGSDAAPASGGGGNSGEGKDPPEGLYPPSKENQSEPRAGGESGKPNERQGAK